ncbi:protein translocase SEC61 complex subunit gamma [Candidatus Woesearchaeota archaeon]|nr:protein translocase SEC61 complex subunit gamma [Candidatus Woesearchaeota archaeon]
MVLGGLAEFAKECLRVLRVTKKPSKVEYYTIVKVSGLGILAIGLIGFILTIAKQLLIG